MAKMDEEEIKALVAEEIRSAKLQDTSDKQDKRVRAMEYYRGVMNDTPSAPNRSKAVSTDISEVMGWLLPGVVRVFTASDNMGVYEPTRPGDEDGARQATDAANYVFWKQNNGYRILWDATHDSLLLGDGIVKHWWDDSEQQIVTTHSGMSEEQIALLLDEEGAEIAAISETGMEIVPGPDGMDMQIPIYDVKIKRVTSSGRVVIECIEPENFLINQAAKSIPEARMVGQRCLDKTRSDLIEMGFKKDLVDNLPSYSLHSIQDEGEARDGVFWQSQDNSDKSQDLIELFEIYLKADVNGDGISETVRAYYAGNAGSGELLDWEVWEDDYPFSQIPCEPVPHRFESRSLFDETSEIQRVKTVVLRQFLDNLYAANNPQKEVEEGSVKNPDELVNPSFGGVIWKSQGSVPINYTEVPLVAANALEAISYLDTVLEKRTGVSRSTMALDPEALQNQTATASQNMRDAAHSQQELIARNNAEGWRSVFRSILKLLTKHQDREFHVRLRDKFVPVDPRSWNAEMDVTINVGLGTGSRDRDMAMLNTILQHQNIMTQNLAGAGFKEEALDMLPKVINTVTKLCESAGLKAPEMYFPDMNENVINGMKQKAAEASQQVPLEIQLEKAKLDMQMQLEQIKMQAARDKESAQMEADVKVKQAELEKEERLAAQQIRFDGYKFEMDQQLQREKMAQDRELAILQMGMKQTEKGLVSKEDERHDEIKGGMSEVGQAIKAFLDHASKPKQVTGPNGKTYTMQVN